MSKRRRNMGGHWNRREVLKALGIGASATLLPYLPRLNMEAEAAGGFAKRLVLFTTPDGSVRSQWRPPAGSKVTESTAGMEFPLDPTQMSYILQPFISDPGRLAGRENISYLDRMLVLDGIDIPGPGDGHWKRASVFSGGLIQSDVKDGKTIYNYHNQPSVDQIVAGRISQGMPFATGIHLAVGMWNIEYSPSARGLAFSRGNKNVISPMKDPVEAYDTVFRNVSAQEDPAADALRLRRQRVFDLVKGDYQKVREQVGAADREKLDAHLEGVSQLESRLLANVSCSVPNRPPTFSDHQRRIDMWHDTTTSLNKAPEITDSQFEIAAHALACGLTNVIGFQWGSEGSTGYAPYVSSFGTTSGDGRIHETSHEGGGVSELTAGEKSMARLNRWWAMKLARFLDLLDSIPEGDGTLLDNTLVVWAPPMSCGWTHDAKSIPLVMFQGKNSYFRMGRYIRWGSMPQNRNFKGYFNSYGGQPINKLLTSICHAMGLTDINKVGDGGSEVAGPLDRLT